MGIAQDLVELEAAQLGIGHLLDRKPSTLSEGERRLVQLARCIVRSPSTLLMDEPLANLEDQVRLRLRGEIVRIHRERGLTTVMATANQHDAMAMSDRIGVLFDGVLDQVGTPFDVYDRPATARVAAFFGEPGMNILPARVRWRSGERVVDVLGVELRLRTPLVDAYVDQDILVGVRPEDLVAGGPVDESIEVHIKAVEPLGHQTMVETLTSGGVRVDCVLPGMPPPVGTTLDLAIPSGRVHLFDAITGQAIIHPLAMAG